MLQLVDVAHQPLDGYVPVVGEAVVQELRHLAAPPQGLRLARINATPYGGVASELLRSLVPLERDLGLNAEWRVITGDERFFSRPLQPDGGR